MNIFEIRMLDGTAYANAMNGSSSSAGINRDFYFEAENREDAIHTAERLFPDFHIMKIFNYTSFLLEKCQSTQKYWQDHENKAKELGLENGAAYRKFLSKKEYKENLEFEIARKQKEIQRQNEELEELMKIYKHRGE